ncbi:cilia-and flagella-associated protein 58 [Trichonephila clavata]|uniref:Cilia-and flagella-associated protein 58 n=1 Tax=Trichonephila clavata TaxID=2740835 RepID=A0A8X6HXD5_TRICU|nr:cilia-and flagella-associated protein 58 [Trichonephila clavata]
MEEEYDSSVKSPIEIIVTDEVGDKPDDQREPVKTLEEDTSQQEQESAEVRTLRPEISSHRESMALQMMDQQYSWLSESEGKYSDLETSFVSKIQFVVVCNHFQKYLKELEENETTAAMAGDFANLFDKFQTCFAAGQRFYHKLQEVTSLKTITDAENLNLKKKLCEQESQISSLQNRLENALQQVDEKGREKMMVYQQLIDLKEETTKASQSLDEEEEELKAPPIDDTEWELIIQELEEELKSLKSDLEFSKERESIASNNLKKSDKRIISLGNELTSTKSELQKQITQKERVEQFSAVTSENLEKKKEAVKELTLEVQELKKELEISKSKANSYLKEVKKFRKDFDAATLDIEKLRRECDSREERFNIIAKQKSNLEVELNGKQGEIFALKAEKSNITNEKNDLARKGTIQENKILELEAKVQSLKEQIMSQQKLIDVLEKERKQNDEKIKEMTNQRNALVDELTEKKVMIAHLQLDFKASEEKLISAVRDIDAQKLEIAKLQGMLRRVEKAKDRIAANALELKRTNSKLHGEIRGLELQVGESEKMVAKVRQQLEEEYAKYKLLAEDERFYRKSCNDANRKIETLNEEFMLLNKHILQLKSHNQEIGEQRKKLEYQLKSTSDELDGVKEFLREEKRAREELLTEIRRNENENKNLSKNISNLEHAIHNLERKVQNITEDKDSLSTRLNEREAQIKSSKERIRLLERDLSVLDRTLYERVDDIKLLKLQLSEMYRGQNLMEGKVENLHIARQELIETQRQLQDNKFKSKKMEGEIQRPVNFHRWRILKGTDPDRAQLVFKNQALQKQLVQKTAELDNKELELREKKQLIQSQSEMLRRRSEHAVEEHLMDCKRELKSRMERLKCLTAENNMYENLMEKYKKEVMALRDQLRKYKMVEFDLKTRPKKKQSVLKDIQIGGG